MFRVLWVNGVRVGVHVSRAVGERGQGWGRASLSVTERQGKPLVGGGIPKAEDRVP
jgi:hypothetical protein